MSDIVQNEPEAPQTAPEAPAPSDVEQRIAAIMGTQQELTQKVQKQESVADEIRALFAGLSQKIDTLAAARHTPYQPSTPGPGFGPAPQQTPLQQQVQQAIQDALKPVIAQSAEAAQKQEKHRQAFNTVIERYPQLADVSTRDAQIFHRIYNSRPDLRQLDDAPALIAEMVRGLRSEERQAERDLDERKHQATVPNTAGRRLGLGQGEATDVKVLKQNYDQLVAKGRTTPLSLREQGNLLNYAVALKSLNLI